MGDDQDTKVYIKYVVPLQQEDIGKIKKGTLCGSQGKEILQEYCFNQLYF